jgi:Fe-S-cluster containining protein
MEHSGSFETDKTVMETGIDRAPPQITCLSVHAGYRCRHAGACCTAGWTVPADPPIYQKLRLHFGDAKHLFLTNGPLPDGAGAVLGVRPGGACVFYEEDGSRLCRIHREIGSDGLPVACRQFPRVALHDARGLLISLSHYCPTAASMLRTSAPIEIVAAPSSLALHGAAEGLDAREALPPLLRPGMLTDPEGYDAWERRALEVLARDDLSPDRAIRTIEAATSRIQGWRPGGTPLRATVHREFDIASASEGDNDVSAAEARVRVALASVPAGLSRPSVCSAPPERWRHLARSLPDADRTFRAYLAARLFGNWVAYYGRGLHAIVEYLKVALAVLEMETARHHNRTDPSCRTPRVGPVVQDPSCRTSHEASAVQDPSCRTHREGPVVQDPSCSTFSELTPWQTVTEAVRNADLLLVHLSDPKDLARRLS